MKVNVIIPAYNEGPSIGKVIRDIPEWVEEVIVVSNNSTDNTEEEAKEAGATVLKEKRKGYGWACLEGMRYIREKQHQPDIVVFLDGDYSDFPGEISLLTNPIAEGDYDMVIGSRVLGKRERGSLTPQQVFGNWLATRLAHIFYGVKYSDLGPFRAIKWGMLESINMSDKTYGWTIEMQLKAAKKGYKIKEVPVSYRKRIGKSKVSGTIKGSVLAGIKIISAIFKYL